MKNDVKKCQGCADKSAKIKEYQKGQMEDEQTLKVLMLDCKDANERVILAEARLEWFVDHFGATSMPQDLLRELIHGFTPPNLKKPLDKKTAI